MKYFLVAIFLISSLFCQAQEQGLPTNNYQAEFDNAYTVYPLVPRGVLEAVSFTMTRLQHLQNVEESCLGIPKTYGVMGLTLNGQNYFHNNLNYVSQVSGISVDDIIVSPEKNILAFAAAYNHQLSLMSPFKNQEKNIAQILTQLSELPNENVKQDFALNSHLYSVLSFMNDVKMQEAYNFPNPNFDLEKVFGAENLNILKSKKVFINNLHVEGEENKVYQQSNLSKKSTDYPPALENLTSCNFSSRGVAVSAVTVHTIQGTYAGAISWANNCSSNVSYHYVLRSSDGQVTQVVLESDKAWHVGSENPYTIGMEHEGFVSDSTWYTAAMYQSSADVVRDITQSGYGISPLRTAYFPWAPTTNYNVSTIPGSCVKIKGHQHYPNQTHTDPGSNWDWDYYYKLINEPTTTIITNNNLTGTITDDGGAGNYSDDERMLYLIQPTGATSITLNITSFDVESTWDYLYIYDGTTPFDDRVGFYTGTTIPPAITVNSGNVLLEFRSDCATTYPGFEISWSSTIPDTIRPTTLISLSPNPALTDFTVNFTDADNIGGSGVLHQFYQVIDYDGIEWRANESNGFFSDNFDTSIHPDWTSVSGIWNITGSYLVQSEDTNANTNIFAAVNQNNHDKYLYHWEGSMDGTGANRRAGFHFYCDSASLANRGNSYFAWFRLDNDKIQIYKVVNDTFQLKQDVSYDFNAATFYDFKVTFNKQTGDIDVYVNDVFKASWQDDSPHLTNGNYVSFRSGDAIYAVNNFKVYHNRSVSELVTVGNGVNDDIRFEGAPAGKIKSIVIDNAKNVSFISEELVNVDLTTAINDIETYNFLVYPNPFLNELIIETNENGATEIKLTDLTGKLIFDKLFQSFGGKIRIDLAPYQLSSGTYLIQLNNETISLIKN
jgi:N-acetyl-anhydromuramyl-L-alanine amidase AmpD